MKKIQSFPLIPLKGIVIFPGLVVPLYIGRQISLQAVQTCLQEKSELVVLSQKDQSEHNPQAQDLYKVGVVGKILQAIQLSSSYTQILFQANHKVKVHQITLAANQLSTEVEIQHPAKKYSPNTNQTAQIIRKNFSHYLTKTKHPVKVEQIISKLEKNPETCNFLCFDLNITIKKKQELLETTDILKQIAEYFELFLALEKQTSIFSQTQTVPQTNQQKKTYLQQIEEHSQKQKNQQEQEYHEKIEAAKLPATVKKIVLAELEKISTAPGFSAEANIVKNYIDWVLKVPWYKQSKETLDLSKAKKILAKNHYGLEKIKTRILEFIAVLKVVGKLQGAILCLVGPPGVGKSTLVKTVADALGRKFFHISLGGVRDEAEIRGHRRTYIGAMPGKIIQTMKKAEVTNPLILLDEIDKLSLSHLGNPAAALLEVLDAEQNHSFVDNYLEVDYDLSKVLFFATANDLSQIPVALKDRLEIIFLSGYTEIEKVHIFQKHLLQKTTKTHGLTKAQVIFSKPAILYLIQNYTREAGIRELERNLASICRKITLDSVLKKQASKKIKIENKNIQNYLGIAKYSFEKRNTDHQIGVATGLAWTNYGGDILFIESSLMKGKGAIQLTGKLGEVMQESAKIALSFVKSNSPILEINDELFKTIDIHIHLPEGATPKDGPSAGVALTTALVSSFTGIPVYCNIAMTGEISLQGRVLSVGGLQPKLLSAKRANIDGVIIPYENKKDLADLPAEVVQNLKIYFVKNVWEVLKIALTKMPVSKELLVQKNKNYFNFSKNVTNFLIPAPDKLTK